MRSSAETSIGATSSIPASGIRAIGKQGPVGKNSRQKKAFKQEEYPRGGGQRVRAWLRRAYAGYPRGRTPVQPKGLYRTGMAKQGWHHVETPRPCIRHPLYLRRVFLCGGGSGRMLFWVPDQNDALAARAFSPERAKRDTRAGCSPQEGRQRPPLAAQRAAIHPKNTLLRMEDSASCGTRPKALPLETAIF